jgi:hypothetical protein
MGRRGNPNYSKIIAFDHLDGRLGSKKSLLAMTAGDLGFFSKT